MGFDLLGEGRWALGQADEHQPARNPHVDPVQAVCVAVESRDLVHARGEHQGALQVIGPGVIGTADAVAQLALPLAAQPRAAMPAEIVEGRDPIGGRSDHEDAFSGDLGQDKTSRLGDLLFPADADPVLGEDLLPLEIEDGVVEIEPPREALGLGLEGVDGPQESRHRTISFEISPRAPRATSGMTVIIAGAMG